MVGKVWLPEMLPQTLAKRFLGDAMPASSSAFLAPGSVGMAFAWKCPQYGHLINPRERWYILDAPRPQLEVIGQVRVSHYWSGIVLDNGAELPYWLPQGYRPEDRRETALLVFRRWLEDQDWRPAEPDPSELEELFLCQLRADP